MPDQLLRRLRRFLDQTIASDINALEGIDRVDDPLPGPLDGAHQPPRNTVRHWRAGSFGNEIETVQSIMIHETSGWPSYASAENFQSRFSCTAPYRRPSIDRPWRDDRGTGPQYFVDPNGTAFTLIGPENLVGEPRVTVHGGNMNWFSVGIENADLGDSGVGPNGARWRTLTDQPEDLTGRKVYLLLHGGAAGEDAVLVWIAQFPNYRDSGDIDNVDDDWDNMLFTERNYRSLVLLSRLVAEQFGVPRNFPVLPYLKGEPDSGNAALFRRLLLADERRDQIAVKLGTTTAAIQANGAAYTGIYNQRFWKRYFGENPAASGPADTPCFRGFLSHGINAHGTHAHSECPGPLFDWHRFAREVWDWWWYPFDLDALGVPSATPRPYRQARRDTPLREYYWDAEGTPARYNQLREPSGLPGLPESFRLPAVTPVYAMANGVVVAARFALDNSPAGSGFLLVRHEVFHVGTRRSLRIDYDRPPTFVWTLTYFLENAGFAIPPMPPDPPGATPAANPDWLKRFIIRLRECELAVRFHADRAADAALNRGWDHDPSGAGTRFATGREIESDAAAYRERANDLQAGRAVLFPLEAHPAPTPVRVCLGDFLGFPNRTLHNQEGIQIEIFSNFELGVRGRTRRAVSASTEDWWIEAAGALRHEADGADLPADGMAWHYPLTDFLEWINDATWASEREKYGGVAAAALRPMTRREP